VNRYLIVIDDIWDIRPWKIIKCALIDNECGSRIITTSRNFEVANNSAEVCKLEPLSYDHSKELFSRLLGGTCTFDQQDEQCTKILQKCGGVPLAIITIASLLSRKPRVDWPEVYNSIGFGKENNEEVDNTRKILFFSYYDLPCHLKTCLLHLSTFPEDLEIKKDTLVWKWVAEGFVPQGSGKPLLFKVGESYFNELINRSMIQPVVDNAYAIKACRVHDMVLDMICPLAKEENFVTILGSNDQPLSSQSNARRLAVHKGVVEEHELTNICKPKLRSFNATRCSLQIILMSLLPSFQVLRVLSIENCELTEDNPCVKSLAGLHHLRYLGLRGTPIRELPAEIGDLRFLVTLDVSHTKLDGPDALPQSVVLLGQLKCLYCEHIYIKLPDGIGNLASLEDLRLDLADYTPNIVKELGKLTELRVLHIDTHMFNDSLIEALLESLSNLQKLEELKVFNFDPLRSGLYRWGGFSPSRQLRHLFLCDTSYSRGLPVWINCSLLPNLTMLHMFLESVDARDFGIIGSLPELRFLYLVIQNASVLPVPDAVPAGGFPKLRHCYTVPPLTYLPGAMPCLESVEFLIVAAHFVEARKAANVDTLQHLRKLEKVDATIDCSDVEVEEAEAAKAAVMHAVDIHPNRPILLLRETGVCKPKWSSPSISSSSSSGSLQTKITDQEEFNEEAYDDDGEDELYPDSDQADEESIEEDEEAQDYPGAPASP